MAATRARKALILSPDLARWVGGPSTARGLLPFVQVRTPVQAACCKHAKLLSSWFLPFLPCDISISNKRINWIGGARLLPCRLVYRAFTLELRGHTSQELVCRGVTPELHGHTSQKLFTRQSHLSCGVTLPRMRPPPTPAPLREVACVAAGCEVWPWRVCPRACDASRGLGLGGTALLYRPSPPLVMPSFAGCHNPQEGGRWAAASLHASSATLRSGLLQLSVGLHLHPSSPALLPAASPVQAPMLSARSPHSGQSTIQTPVLQMSLLDLREFAKSEADLLKTVEAGPSSLRSWAPPENVTTAGPWLR